MKKLYTLMAAAVALSASAATPTLVKNLPVQASRLNADFVLPAAETPLYAPERAAVTPPTGAWNVLGEGMVAEGMLLDINEELTIADPGMTWAVTIEQSATDPNWYRSNIYNENSPINEVMGEPDLDYFYFNVADPNKVYSSEFLIGGGTYKVYQQVSESGLFDMLANPGALSSDPKYGKLENGLITFPTGSFWVLDEDAGQFHRINNQGAFKIALPGTTIAPLWEDLGTATFYDGMLVYLFTDSPVQIETELMVQVSTDNDKVFRFVRPWEIVNGTQRNFVIDVSSDKNIGVVDLQPTGIALQTEGPLYLMSYSSNYASIEDFMADPDGYPAHNITFDDATRKLVIPANGCFYYFPEYKPESLYTMNDVLESYITIPESAGVQDVIVEDNTAIAPEYFNLQGVRVDNPESGLYIVRQGNKVRKVVIRR